LIYADLMGQALLTERRAKQITGVLSCYDRVIVQGTLPVFCCAERMTVSEQAANPDFRLHTVCQAVDRRY
jgi:hypothetical protein